MRRHLGAALDALVVALASLMPGYVPPSRWGLLTDEQLWAEWDASAAELHRPASMASFLALVERRRRCLEELEARDPAALARRLGVGLSVDEDELRRRLGS